MMSGSKYRILSFFLAVVLSVSGFLSFSFDSAAASDSIKFEKSSYTMNKGDKQTLKLLNASGKLKWSSTSPKVAKVDSKGKVTALKEGTTRIVVTTQNNKSYSCSIRVFNAVSFKYKGHRYTAIDHGLTWEDAKEYCESLGGHLMTVNSKGEQKALVKALKKKTGVKRKNFWLGAQKDETGKMRWITGESFSYTAWGPGQPDNFRETCLMIYRFNNPHTGGDDTYLWNDLSNLGTHGNESWFGLNNFGFICEWEA